jgi:hypothetical protein
MKKWNTRLLKMEYTLIKMKYNAYEKWNTVLMKNGIHAYKKYGILRL